jgi:hypothetical protein
MAYSLVANRHVGLHRESGLIAMFKKIKRYKGNKRAFSIFN